MENGNLKVGMRWNMRCENASERELKTQELYANMTGRGRYKHSQEVTTNNYNHTYLTNRGSAPPKTWVFPSAKPTPGARPCLTLCLFVPGTWGVGRVVSRLRLHVRGVGGKGEVRAMSIGWVEVVSEWKERGEGEWSG